jgi:DNA repair protein RecN (Recombination protein N)
MGSARLVVDIAPRPSDGQQTADAIDETGTDHVEFLASTNPGEPPRALARIASGGELARIMLAFRSALAAVDRTPVLVFDELDQGVGGRTGHYIGERLAHLSRYHQVLCITHLPQVAVYADRHYGAAKRIVAGRTVTSVECFNDAQRTDETAAMLAGPRASAAARANAHQLLEQARTWKRLQDR